MKKILIGILMIGSLLFAGCSNQEVPEDATISSTGDEDVEYKDDDRAVLKYGEDLALNNGMFKLKNQDSYTRTNTLSLSWRECDGWKVKRYHDKWIGLIYDRKKDCYKSFDIKGENTASRLLYRKIRRFLS